jgi:quinol monooxygenase YgiN
MSVLVSLAVRGDTATFERALAERADDFVAISERGKAAGALHHRFAIGDGFVLVEDEWESAEQFQSFFSDDALQKFIAEVGGDMSAEPMISIARPVHSADEF